MSPADILAAARQNIVGPYLPAKAEWMTAHPPPVVCSVDGVEWDCVVIAVFAGGINVAVDDGRGGQLFTCLWPDVRLDTRIPAVRDHLVRLGCPEWARDVPAAVWAWGSGAEIRAALGEWFTEPWEPTTKRRTMACDQLHMQWPLVDLDGWRLPTFPGGRPGPHRASGPETGGLGRACADLAALNAGCILREPGGWLVPLPGGGVGYFKEPSP